MVSSLVVWTIYVISSIDCIQNKYIAFILSASSEYGKAELSLLTEKTDLKATKFLNSFFQTGMFFKHDRCTNQFERSVSQLFMK